MKTKPRNRIGLVVPHIFIHRDILPHTIFSPGQLAIDVCEQLQTEGADITLFAPGPVATRVPVISADLSYFERELAGRSDTYLELLKKHPFTFISLARQVQSEIIAEAYRRANNDEFDLIHIYTNEEDIALPFAKFCNKPVVFTHHDPFNFLVKYKNIFPKYKHLPWLSVSNAQRRSMPKDTNWIKTIYHGIKKETLTPVKEPSRDYVAFLGRIIEPKGVHLAIAAMQQYNQRTGEHLRLRIGGKHYADHAKDTYWQTKILPHLGDTIEYIGHIKDNATKRAFLGNAKALLVPSTFDEPFGMVMIEALACDTPVIGLDSGAIPEVIEHGKTGFIVPKGDDRDMSEAIADALTKLPTIKPGVCRAAFEASFTLEHMAKNHLQAYEELIRKATESPAVP